jgi:hypothetical protein
MISTMTLRRAITTGLMGCLVVLMSSRAAAQTTVEFSLQFPSYDVIYLSDFLDPTTGKISSAVPNMSFEMRTNPPGQVVNIKLEINAEIQLRGEAAPEKLLTRAAVTRPFDLNGYRIITSRDLSGGLSDIKVDDYLENESAKKKLEDHAKRFPTAPVGTYRFTVRALSGVTGAELGKDEKTITVSNASASEVQVTLIDPLPGAVLASLFPTFSWTSEKPEVTLYVYEKRPVHRSPEEAITGIPYLKQTLQGAQTFTYPADAARRLENGKGYYWFVETSVTTNRGVEKRQSEIRFFRVRLDNTLGQTVEQVFNSLGGRGAGTISTLLQMGWVPSGPVTLDGRTLSREELVALFNKLVNERTDITIRVESQ